MTTKAGHFSLDWIAECRSNEGDDETLEAWVCRARNCEMTEIDKDGSVWCGRKRRYEYDGVWLSQDACDQTVATIERGL